MTTENTTTTTENSQTTTSDESEKTDITIDELKQPGHIFEAGDIQFITTGGVGCDGLNVLRRDTMQRDQLNIELLEEDIEKGNVRLLETHSSHSEVGVDRHALSTLADYVQYDVENLSERVAADEVDAMQTAHDALSDA